MSDTDRLSGKLLTEDELMLLQDQLIRKQKELADREHETKTREIECEERLLDLHERELALGASGTINESKIITGKGNDDENADEECTPMLVREIRALKSELNDLKVRLEDVSHGVEPPSAANTAGNTTANTAADTRVNTQLSFKDVLESIPSFTGDNIPVLKFSRACQRAKDMLPLSLESTFTRLLRNKLKDRAYTAVEDDAFRSVKSFTDRLKEIFGASRSVNQYKGELGNLAKGKTEHVLDYISRVKDLHSAIIEGEIQSLGRLTRAQRESLEDETMECFVTGLPPDFRLRLKFEGYVDLNSAYKIAIKIEKEMERDKSRFHEINKNSKGSSEPQTKPGSKKAKDVTCDHCKKSGHLDVDCWIKNPDKRPQKSGKAVRYETSTQSVKQTKSESSERVKCSYCNLSGHTEDVCYKRKRDAKNSENAKQPSANQGASRKDNATERPVRTVQAKDESEPSKSD